jgi:hypothetical protein
LPAIAAPDPPAVDPDDTEAVLAANRGFYEAFEERDMDAMSDLWERSGRATCTHPGWATLRGWGPIAASFFALFQGPRQMQFVLTEERVHVVGDLAWVSVDENLLGDQSGATIAAVNIFVRADSRGPIGRGPIGRGPGRASSPWRMVCHHGSIVNHSIVHERRPES